MSHGFVTSSQVQYCSSRWASDAILESYVLCVWWQVRKRAAVQRSRTPESSVELFDEVLERVRREREDEERDSASVEDR